MVVLLKLTRALDPGATKPTVTGVVDADRSWWGDPLADWAVYRADSRAVTSERDAFWLAYGGRPAGRDVEWRLELYRGRHLVAERVEAARNGHFDHVGKTVTGLGHVLSHLTAESPKTAEPLGLADSGIL